MFLHFYVHIMCTLYDVTMQCLYLLLDKIKNQMHLKRNTIAMVWLTTKMSQCVRACTKTKH